MSYTDEDQNLNGPLCLVHGAVSCDCCTDCGARGAEHHADFCIDWDETETPS